MRHVRTSFVAFRGDEEELASTAEAMKWRVSAWTRAECARMNFEAIHAFVEAVSLGSFAAVARARRIAPSSVSRLVSDLEDELEVRLFQRTTRRLSLTEAGQVYLERVRPLLDELVQARDSARDLGTLPRGTLRVAVADTFAQLHLARWLPKFLAAYPDLRVELALDARYTDLVSEQIDVAIRLGPAAPTSAIAKKLCPMPRVVVASPERLTGRSRLRPEVLAEEPCLVFPHEGRGATWKFRDRKSVVREIEPNARVTAADGVVLRSLALRGEGFALLPRWLCADELRAGTLVDAFPRYDVTATDFDATISLLYASRSYLPIKVRAFVDFVAAKFRDGAPWETTTSAPSARGPTKAGSRARVPSAPARGRRRTRGRRSACRTRRRRSRG